MEISEAELRAEVRAWLADNWDGDLGGTGESRAAALIAWKDRTLEAGYLVPTWPTEWWGRSYRNELAEVIEEEFAAKGAPGAHEDRHNIPANTVLRYGGAQLKQDVIRDALTGRARFCLLYSEPGAGSDLAGVRATAVHQGDRWIVNGQKVWTSSAREATHALLLARTDWDAPKHKGLSYFVVPMGQPGIDVRPLHQITGESHFNEVFLTDAAIPAEYIVGEPGQGWKVLQTALAYERSIMGDSQRLARHEGVEIYDLVALARAHGKLDDPVIRDALAQVIALRELNDLNNVRAKATQEPGTSSSIMSLGKLAMAGVLHAEGRMRTDILGADSVLAGDANPEADDVNFYMFRAFMWSIGGGTNQIQRNIISERVLGLPKEIEVDRDVPFRQVRSS